MDTLQTRVSLALRDTETCTAAAEVRELLVNGPLKDDRRVLAVVTHSLVASSGIDPTTVGEAPEQDRKDEQGCLFVMKYKSPSIPELYPYLLFPIKSTLRTFLKQREGNLDGSDFEVMLKIPRSSVKLASSDMHTLSVILEEVRRLKSLKDPTASPIPISPTLPHSPITVDSSDVKTESSSTIFPSSVDTENTSDEDDERHWEWLHFYLSQKSSRILPSQQPKPRDICLIINGHKLSPASAGLPGDEDGDIALIRDQWVYRQFSARREEYSQLRHLRLKIGTFNVNGKAPSESLTSWIRASMGCSDSADGESQPSSKTPGLPESASSGKPSTESSGQERSSSITIGTQTQTTDSSSVETSGVTSSLSFQASEDTLAQSSPPSSIVPDSSGDLPDLFVLGFQELDLSTEALFYGTSTLKEDTWVTAIFDALGEFAEGYTKLVSKQLVGVLMVVIIRKNMQSIVKEVGVREAGVGLMGIMGNKGATAIRLRLYSTTVTFVCSHLAAFDDYVDKRNSDFAELARKLEFPITWKGARGTRSLTANVWETDMLFWLGDLNYRIDLPDEEVRTLLSGVPRGHENNTLLKYDQLKMAARHERAFVNFVEHEINFLPTYRFGGWPADQLGYDLKRKPAWTDRILHLSADPTLVSQKSYLSHPTITLSDHQPVSADFDIFLDDHDPHGYHGVASSIFRKLGDFEDSDEMPTTSIVDGLEVDLGQVSYMCPMSCTVRIKNEGKVACAFRFIPLDPGGRICKEWLQLRPLDGILLPGETESIYIRVNIDKRTASFLNHGNTRLEDSLILHIAKGTDHLISVFGSYQPTCFANSLAWLVRSPGPIRTQGDTQLLPEANTLSTPRELMFLIEWLMTNAQDVDDLFVAPAEESLVSIIREHLDTERLDSGTAVRFPPEADHNAVALAFGEALVQFLDSLTEPVIPWILHPRCALARDREDVFEILDHVPSFARNVYVTLTAFLHFIAQGGGPERSAALVRVFADVLLRDNPRAPPGVPQLTPLGKRNFLLYVIA